MPAKGHMTGMLGVYLTAAFIATSSLSVSMGLAAGVRAYNRQLASQLYLPASISDLRKILGKEMEYDPQAHRYHWEITRGPGRIDMLNAWSRGDNRTQIESIHIEQTDSPDLLLIDKHDQHCVPDRFSAWVCEPEYPRF
jgi:hypothetical protein